MARMRVLTPQLQQLRDATWGDLVQVAEKFADADAPTSTLVGIMVEFATILAMNSAPDSRSAHDLMAQAMDNGRRCYDDMKSKEGNTNS